MRTLVWFRGKDLRLTDHIPLREALKSSEIIPFFVLDSYFFAPEKAQELPHRIQFLLDSLKILQKSLRDLGSDLIIVSGKSTEIVPYLFRHWKADRIVAQRWVEPFARERDRRIEAILGDRFELYEGETLLKPGVLRTDAGRPYQVFSQFARSFLKKALIVKAFGAPQKLPSLPLDIDIPPKLIPECEDLGIHKNPRILAGGEKNAKKRLLIFLKKSADNYKINRDRMDLEGTSRLSADIKFGTISVRQIWNEVKETSFRNELIWREFNYGTLWDRPGILQEPFKNQFIDFPWGYDEVLWQAWIQGQTGYPLVDASARQLLTEGFVHNRARMISASFLTKHLLIHYRHGEAHYMKYLTDGDWAQNNAGWQWSAGCGCDAQPYFRIFNPVLQGQKFDPEGDYVRRFVPELSKVPAKYIHSPWLAAPELRKGYPKPIVDHAFGRERFLKIAKDWLRSA